jgi:hypothetical protein
MNRKELADKSSSSSPWHMWKFASHFSQMTFAFEILITIGFWSFVYDAPVEPSTSREVCLFMDHSVPFTVLCLDFIFHRIYYEKAHLLINCIFLGCYGVVNFVYTKDVH